MQFTEPDSRRWQGALCQSQMNQIPFQSVLAPPLFWCHHGYIWEALLDGEFGTLTCLLKLKRLVSF